LLLGGSVRGTNRDTDNGVRQADCPVILVAFLGSKSQHCGRNLLYQAVRALIGDAGVYRFAPSFGGERGLFRDEAFTLFENLQKGAESATGLMLSHDCPRESE